MGLARQPLLHEEVIRKKTCDLLGMLQGDLSRSPAGQLSPQMETGAVLHQRLRRDLGDPIL